MVEHRHLAIELLGDAHEPHGDDAHIAVGVLVEADDAGVERVDHDQPWRIGPGLRDEELDGEIVAEGDGLRLHDERPARYLVVKLPRAHPGPKACGVLSGHIDDGVVVADALDDIYQ